MKLLKLFSSFSLMAFSITTVAATAVAPANRIRIWEGSALSFPDTKYSIGTTTVMGTIKTLKYDVDTVNLLTTLNVAANAGGLDMTSKYKTPALFNGSNHYQITENGGKPGQCVAFAKAMTGVSMSTANWYPGSSLPSYLDFTGRPKTDKILAPGTMIAHFGGKSIYIQNSATPHVAIFLSWSLNAQGIVDGVNVVDANLAWTIAGNSGSAAGLIQKHKLAWVCNAGASCGKATDPNPSKYHITFFASNYHVVDVR